MDESAEPGTLAARLLASALTDRRGYERALHDGVQQDLISLAVRLQLVRGISGAADESEPALLDELQRDVRDALERLRLLGSEIYPAMLDARGLPDALRAAARGSEAPVRVEAGELRRFPRDLEAAVYFACRALLDDLDPGTEATLVLREEGERLELEVVGRAAGDLARARDLVEGAGGVFAVEPRPGGGARVRATFPVVPS